MPTSHPRDGAFARSVTFVLGTRPEIVKLAPLARLFGERARVAYTGQHYDARMSEVFFTECGLRQPDATLEVGGYTRAEQIGAGLSRLDGCFAAGEPDVVVVQGDTNSALAGALAANARGIPLVHVEAGLRSHDRAMPEEHNRVLIDHVADLLCAPTPGNAENLRGEGIDPRRVAVTGNTVVEALTHALPDPAHRGKLLADFGVEPGRFILATVHRPENTDDPRRLGAIVAELAALGEAGRPVLFPVHPRTRAALRSLGDDGGAGLSERIVMCDPLGYRDFLALAAECALLVSDSGGIQEEATVLRRPLIVVRRSTERPEALEKFAVLVEPGPAIGLHARALLADLPNVLRGLADLRSPFGDGLAATRIEALIRDRFPLSPMEPEEDQEVYVPPLPRQHAVAEPSA
ncbi:MAG TPA: UDP-N-acetylglucosamine 2-epimerase (non-hydrolyzing) [Actinospica sp.]|jgi:UDP-N-acetylglucosamine 2-epimerase (non-hydrolysing)|nr:UDP-N-acetylglucosamine 2-epimerase (non-hydrolyzing) [Actinospica sp.]